MGASTADTAMKWFGLAGFVLNFTIESGTFNNFLHEEANQLVLNTLKCARRHLLCGEYKWLWLRAKETVTAPGEENFENWGWTNPYNQNTFAWIFMETERKMKGLDVSCEPIYPKGSKSGWNLVIG